MKAHEDSLHEGNADRSVLLVVSFLHNQTCGCFVTSITVWLTFCQYQFYSQYMMTVMMADVVPTDCLFIIYLLFVVRVQLSLIDKCD